MDYLILGFLAFAVLAFMWFKMKLALLDAGTPKYGYPAGGQAEGGGPASIEDRYRSSSIFSLLLVFGVIVLFGYFLVRSGHNPNGVTDYVLEEVLQQETHREPQPKRDRSPRQNPPGQVAKDVVPRTDVPRTNVAPAPEANVENYEHVEVNKAPRLRVNEGKVSEAPVFDPSTREVPRGGGYWLQAAALSNKSKAFELAAYYQDLDDLEAKVIPEGGMYKVRIGPFRDRSSARATRSKYQKNWFIVED